ncbi:protein of unknown function [Georgfuchsia toluolica]|uniref:Uncharacterized protein n=1 Tax=Georgfuchsia toluolica TaxID=424218 RepID=A0A916J657_9PROT|nr:protein of unknown function [Georgfuchsia toluolica]
MIEGLTQRLYTDSTKINLHYLLPPLISSSMQPIALLETMMNGIAQAPLHVLSSILSSNF